MIVHNADFIVLVVDRREVLRYDGDIERKPTFGRSKSG